MLSNPRTVVLIIGLPGSGKTVLAKQLQEYLNCLWFNADKVRATISSDLGFSETDRMTQARRLGQMCALSLEYSPCRMVIADFVCPTEKTREEFRKGIRYPSAVMQDGNQHAQNVDFLDLPQAPEVFSIFMNTIPREDSRYLDTARLFERPRQEEMDIFINAWPKNAGAKADLLRSIARVIDSAMHPGLVPAYHPRGWYFDGEHLHV